METPIKKEIVDGLVAELGITDFAKATIREVKQVAAKSEKASGVEFIKMEMGIPGLPAAQAGERSCLSVCESIHRYRYQTRGLHPRDRFDAGHLRLVPHLFTTRQAEGYRVIHRPRIPCSEDAAGGDGREVPDLRCVSFPW